MAETNDISVEATKTEVEKFAKRVMRWLPVNDVFGAKELNDIRYILWMDKHMTDLNVKFLNAIIDYAWTLDYNDGLLLYRNLLILANTVINRSSIVEAQYTGFVCICLLCLHKTKKLKKKEMQKHKKKKKTKKKHKLRNCTNLA